MRHINPTHAGLAVGGVFALWHLLWVSLVAFGVAGAILNYILKLHFIQIAITLAPFQMGLAVTLVALTFAIGFLFGFVFALIWNWLGSTSDRTRVRQ